VSDTIKLPAYLQPVATSRWETPCDHGTHHLVTQVADMTGLTYRQIDYWRRKGWVTACNAADAIGTGKKIYLSLEQVEIIRKVARLVNRGLPPRTCFFAVRRMSETGTDYFDMPEGVRVTLLPLDSETTS
jgi:hypothetical protein